MRPYIIHISQAGGLRSPNNELLRPLISGGAIMLTGAQESALYDFSK